MADLEKLDLDALAPSKAEVTLDGKVMIIEPATTGQIMRISKVTAKMKSIETGVVPEDIDERLVELKEIMVEFIPALADHNLSLGQMMALVTLVMNMSMPKDTQELEKRNIKPDTDPKAPAA